MFRIVPMTLETAADVAWIDEINFPDFPGEGIPASVFEQRIAIFPDGQLVALSVEDDNEPKVIGFTTTYRIDRLIDDQSGYYLEHTDHRWVDHHVPNGAWLYGVTMAVLPDYRGQGIGRMLYQARAALAARLNMRGEMITGLMPGYQPHQKSLTAQQYADKVVAGERYDPTMSMQLRNGFMLSRLLKDYVRDPRSDGWCTLMLRHNPNYDGL